MDFLCLFGACFELKFIDDIPLNNETYANDIDEVDGPNGNLFFKLKIYLHK